MLRGAESLIGGAEDGVGRDSTAVDSRVVEMAGDGRTRVRTEISF